MPPYLVLAALFVSNAAFGQPQPLTEAQRAELRKKADELRERNAREREEIQKNFRPATVPTAPEAKGVTHHQICRAAVAALMGRDPSIVQITREQDGIIYLAYTRPTDGTRWENRCRIVGNRVNWATLTGRWRDDHRDERVTYEVKPAGGVVIRQTFTDGSISEKSFPAAAF
jgi:hypothetical protein